MSSEVRIAIIGCGVIGPVHAETISKCGRAAVVATCDVIKERAERCAELFGGRAYADYAEMLAAERPDAVSVCTPHFNHAEIAINCLRSGAHVLCEKPLAITRADMDAMIETARAEQRILAGVFQRRFDATTAAMKRAVDEGLFGRVLNAGAYVRCARDKSYYGGADWRGTWAGEGGSVLINQAIHSVDAMQWLAGPVRRVFGHWTRLELGDSIETEDTASAFVEFRSGALGSIEVTSASQLDFEAGVHFYGTHGSFRLCTGWPDELTEHDLDSPERSERLSRMLADGKQPDQEVPLGKDYYGTSHVRQIADFVGAIREGRAPAVTGQSARHAVDICLSVYESARTGRAVDVTPAAGEG